MNDNQLINKIIEEYDNNKVEERISILKIIISEEKEKSRIYQLSKKEIIILNKYESELEHLQVIKDYEITSIFINNKMNLLK